MRSIALAFASVWLTVSLAASEPAQLHPGSTVAVIAVRDTQGLTICPVIGKHVGAAAVSTPQIGMGQGRVVVISEPKKKTPVTVYHPRPGVQVLAFHDADTVTARVTLPVASAGVFETSAPAADPAAKAAIETALRGKGYAVIDSPAAAEFVLYVQSTYRPSPTAVSVVSTLVEGSPKAGASTAPRSRPEDIRSQTEQELARRADRSGGRDAAPPARQPNPSDSDRYWDGGSSQAHEWSGDWRESVLAVLVPAAAYEDKDVTLLLSASVWQGMATGHVKTAPGVATLAPASLDALVEQLRGKARKHPVYLPLCAVNAQAR